jgi:hypothetical protein
MPQAPPTSVGGHDDSEPVEGIGTVGGHDTKERNLKQKLIIASRSYHIMIDTA